MRKNRHVIVFVSILASLCILFPAAGLESSNPDVASQKSVVHDSGNNSRPMEYFNVSHEVKDNLFRTIRLPCGETYQYPYTTIHEEKLEYQDIRVEKTVTQKSNLTQHEPIWIDGDNNFTSKNGVTNGTGTITDPYIIEGWKIERRVDIPHIRPWCAGIVIKNTIKYVVVKDIHIINPLYKRYMMYAGGITLSNVSNCKLQNIIIETDGEPLTWLDMPDDHGVEIRGQSNNISIENTTIIGHGESISIYKSCNVTLRNNTLNNTLQPFNIYGNQTKHYIFDVDSSNTANDKTVKYLIGEENLFFDNSSKIGFLGLVSCANVTVKNFTYSGILLANVTNGMIIDSDIRFVIISLSSNISVINTTVHGDGYCGFHFSLNKNTVLLNSTIYNTTCGIIAGSLHSSLSPGFSLIKNLTIYSCYIGVSLCGSNHRIEDSIINATSVKPGYSPVGIWIGWSAKNNTIDNTTIIGGGAGILLCDTSGNIITNCTIKGFGEDGVFFGSDACNNTIVNCNITGWWFGISMLGGANNNTITKNTFYNNTCYGYAYGIEISYEDWTGTFWGYSNDNLIYHNNFIGNDHNVYDDCYNFWDNGEYGNYWDDYSGNDEDNDGIGNKAYSILGGKNRDNYPIINPIEWIPPEIISTYPKNGDVDVNLNASVVINFSEPLNRLSVIGNITVSPDVETKSYNWSNDNKTLTLTLSSNLSSYTTYSVSVSTNIRDLSQNNLKNAYVFSFRTKDITPPSANAGLDKEVNEGVEIELIASLSFDNVGIVNWTWSFMDQGEEVFLHNEIVHYTFTQPGYYVITLNVSDNAGNWAVDIVNVTVKDITPPIITIISPENNTITNQSIILVYSVSDNMDNPADIVVNVENGTVYTDEKSYTVIVNATDSAGNSATQTIIFTIDKTKPNIIISGVADGAYYNTDVAPIVDVTDANLNTTSITLNGAPFASGTTITAENTYTLVVQANDKAGNNANKTIIFIIDKTAPTITISSESSQTTNKNIFTISWSASEDVQYYEISTDGINWENVSTDTSHTFTLSKGANTLYVRGTDIAGNKGTDMITVTYKKEEPKGFIPAFETAAFLFAVIGVCIILLRRKLSHYFSR